MNASPLLVSGGAGYIGSHTALALRKAGYTPVVIDNLVHGHAWAAKFGPLEIGDIGDAAFIRRVCATYRPVALLHFAAFAEIGESVANPQKYWDNNVVKAKILFDAVRDCGLRQIVFSSTAAVYGLPAHDGLIREDAPLAPVNPYGATKLAAENYLRGLDTHGLRSVCLRYFNAAGAAADENIGEAHWPESHLIPRAIRAALGLDPGFSVFGTDYPTPDGTAVRDYIHVEDLAAAHLAALRYLDAGGVTEACNLGTGEGASVRAIIDTVAACFGRDVPAMPGPRRAGDPPSLVADTAKAEKLLGWKATRKLQDIVRSAAAWHQSPRYQEATAARQISL